MRVILAKYFKKNSSNSHSVRIFNSKPGLLQRFLGNDSLKILVRVNILALWLILFSFFFNPTFVSAAEKEIKKITFLNVNFEGEDELIDLIQSEKSEPLEPRLVKLDKILLTNYYRKFGFLDVEVQDSIYYNKRRRTVNLFYSVSEGQRYFYGGVRTKGNYEITSAELAKRFGNIGLYESFDESKVSEAVKQVENLYYNSGKPYVRLNVNYLYEQDSVIVVLMDIEENQTVYIHKVKYSGLKMVKKFLIRRELAFKTGDRYSRIKMEESQKNIYSTGLFKYVRFEMEPIPDQPGQTILTIMVQEKDPRWIGVHFGVAHEQEAFYGNKFELTLQGGHRNLYGNARSFSLHITPSLIYDLDQNKIHNTDNKIAFRFVEPWIFATRTPGIFNLAYEQYRPLNSGNFDLWRSSFDLKRNFYKINQLTASLSAKFVDLIDETAIDSTYASAVQADKSTVYALTFYWKRDTRENLFNPHNSSYSDVSVAFSYSSGKNTDGDLESNNYILLNASWQIYLPWRPKVRGFKRGNFTYAARLKSGMIIEPAGKGLIPIYDLFYAGGATSVRGYQEQLLGPAAEVDENGRITKAAGGKLLTIGNLEGRIPLFWLFVAEVFVDGGYVWPEISDFNIRDFKFSTGAGIALITPLGPLRLDYGYKLIPSKLDSAPGAYHIGIYFAF